MGVEQWILIGLIVLLVIAYPILVSSRNKKENQRMQQQTNSLKKGDKVMLTSGVVGKIVDLEQDGERKLITIETGSSKNKGYLTVDAYAVYQVITDAPAATLEVKTEAKPEVKEVKTEPTKEPAAPKTHAKKTEGESAAQETDTTAEIEAQVSDKKPRKTK